ncbi:hypothetical protein [uncultured Salegentibacter sp.]|uniref:hypothetical protein n=1 Tax=uncultured Salegentibacter sp. TaxID=259320 RepID=UPI002595735E|nr:hypothetical protein [uncultured Salegentibacter sp.]
MKIFSPFAKQEHHPYLLELNSFSKHTILQKGFKEFDQSFELVHIHWPEAIFNWKEPTQEGLIDLQKEIKIWKKKVKIIYTKHDYYRTKGRTKRFDELFNLIEERTDVFIHLGEYSKNLYKKKYPKAQHELINHHLFETSFPKFPKNEARKKLGIDGDSFVIIAPGNIRTAKERAMVLNAFKSIKEPKKVLISTNMKLPSVHFRGRVRLKKIVDVQKMIQENFKKKYQPPEFLFTYAPISKDELGTRMSAADIVLVPRVDLLNSGIVYLGLSFSKVTVGPAIGNIEEQLKLQGLPVFDPNSANSVAMALKEAIEMFKYNSFKPKITESLAPVSIAKELDDIYLKYANCS